MRIMSFNTQHCLNFIERVIDFDKVARTISELSPDVVGLNEIRGAGSAPEHDAQTETLSSLTGMKYYYFAQAIGGEKKPYGNAILSRIPIVSAERIFIPDPEAEERVGKFHYETRCILKARLENGYTLLITHFGLNPDEQANAVETVIANLEPERCILMGDFNMSPDDALLLPIRERLTDTADAFDAPRLSFPSVEPARKIDYIFVSPDVRVISADIPQIVTSDHFPYVAQIE